MTGATAGTLAIMVSCPKPTLREVEPVLKVFGRPSHAGETPGLARTAKLADDLLAATALAATTEAMAMVVGAAVRQMLAAAKARIGVDSDFTHIA